MEAVYLKSQDLAHHDICRLVRISKNILRPNLRQLQEGGERLKQTDWDGPTSELSDHRQTLEEHFRENPTRFTTQAAVDTERLTGGKRVLAQVRKFLNCEYQRSLVFSAHYRKDNFVS